MAAPGTAIKSGCPTGGFHPFEVRQTMFKKLLAAAGVGGATVDIRLANPRLAPGEVLSGEVVVQGGSVAQRIEAIELLLMAEVEVESGDHEHREARAGSPAGVGRAADRGGRDTRAAVRADAAARDAGQPAEPPWPSVGGMDPYRPRDRAGARQRRPRLAGSGADPADAGPVRRVRDAGLGALQHRRRGRHRACRSGRDHAWLLSGVRAAPVPLAVAAAGDRVDLHPGRRRLPGAGRNRRPLRARRLHGADDGARLRHGRLGAPPLRTHPRFGLSQ
ncbi:hypothetical protein E5K04_04680 [Crenobacter intestini]|uniref:Uncharacterized protein n=1 Tax=Crenobacter intestini TaxID=2563443 RepID=A0A4T0V1F7_9NEIS|nr:hypothetical protein E5K04_04680 [Crenobacter intestini]